MFEARHNKLIVLDFDHTVFNTTMYVKALQVRLGEQFGISSDDFLKTRDSVKKGCVVIDIDEFVSRLPHNDKNALHEAIIDEIRQYASTFVFDDVPDFIQRHADYYDLLLVTHGDTELQTEKIIGSGVGLPFEISTESKAKVLEPYAAKYKECYVFDDKTKNLKEIKDAFPNVKAYFVARPEDMPYAEDDPDCDCIDERVDGLTLTLK